MKYFLSHTEIFQLNLEYISQINSELDQLRRIRDLLQGGGGRLSLGSNDQIVVHPSPRSAVLGGQFGHVSDVLPKTKLLIDKDFAVPEYIGL